MLLCCNLETENVPVTQGENKPLANLDIQPTKKNFLLFCDDDWAGLWVLISDVRQDFPKLSQDQVRETTLAILRDLLEEGLIQAGQPVGRGKFDPWKSVTDETIQRIRDEWIKLGRDPIIGDVTWLEITQKGVDLVNSWRAGKITTHCGVNEGQVIPKPITNDEQRSWIGADNGMQFRFYVTDEEMASVLLSSMPSRYEPYQLITWIDRTKWSKYELGQFLELRKRSCHRFYIHSKLLTPDPRFPEENFVSALAPLQINGLISLAHGTVNIINPQAPKIKKFSMLFFSSGAANVDTGELRVYDGYREVFDALKENLEKILVYRTVKSESLMMSKGIVEKYRKGKLLIEDQPILEENEKQTWHSKLSSKLHRRA
jgi:hypothetical protein